jgi:hypothetical protein
VWNWATTPFIQVTSDGTEAPIRQTVSCAGADDEDDDDDPPADELLLELQPAIASAAAVPSATSAAGVFLSPTAGTPSGMMNSASRL